MRTQSDLNRESKKQIQTAYFFDVDGVITDPQEKKITEPEIIDFLTTALSNGMIVNFITGRSTEWVIRNVFPFMLQKNSKGDLFEHFFIVGEKGGTWAEYLKGRWEHFKDDSLCVPENIQHQALKLAARKPYSDIGANLDPKESMFSWEMMDGMDIEKYQEIRKPLVEDYKKLLKDAGLESEINVDPTTIAIDIESKKVGKRRATRRSLEWMHKKGIEAEHFIAVGDSHSDMDMADELYDQGKSVEFWYVNPKKPISQKVSYSIHLSQNEFCKGTLELIKKHS